MAGILLTYFADGLRFICLSGPGIERVPSEGLSTTPAESLVTVGELKAAEGDWGEGSGDVGTTGSPLALRVICSDLFFLIPARARVDPRNL